MNLERHDTRQQLIDCGRQLVAGKGFVGVGLAEILATAGVPKGSFYHYFASKEVFGVALIDGYFAQYMSWLDALAARPELAGAQRLLAYFERWTETQVGDDAASYCLIVKLSAEIADLSDSMRTAMLAGTERILRWLTDGIAVGQADGSIACAEAPDELAQWLYETWLGASLLAKLRRDRSAFDTAMRRSRTLLAGK